MASASLKIGLVGAAGRGGSSVRAIQACGATIHALCDTDAGKLASAAADLGIRHTFTDYSEMLAHGDLDAVLIGTPMHLHVPQSIGALERGLHVLCEVPAGVSIDECRQLTCAARASKAVYMLAENYLYTRSNMLIRELVRQGRFGTPYYAEGEYLHELKLLNEQTPWRRTWQTGIEGVTYPTHSLGPILSWMPGDRVVRVCCEGSGHHYRDPRGQSYHSESPVMLCKTAGGALIKIRVDMLSDRPHAMTNYQFQGTDGCYESSRGGPGERDKLWLRALSPEPRWFDLDSLAEPFLPPALHQADPAAQHSGHGGGDYFIIRDFIGAATGQIPCPVDIDAAMDMTLPGLVSQQSILENGRWRDVPDSRRWRQTVATAAPVRHAEVWQETARQDRNRRIFEEELDGFLPRKILDFHVHLINPGIIPGGRPFDCAGHPIDSYTLEDLRQDFADALPGRQTAAVCFGFPDITYDRASNNAYVAACDDGARFFALRLFDPRADTPAGVRADLVSGRFRGLKPYPDYARAADIHQVQITDMLPPWAMEVVNDCGSLVMLHIPRKGRLADPLNQGQIIDYCRRWPRARIILAHIGRAYFLKNALGHLEPLAELPNLYFDLAMVNNTDVIEHLFRTIPIGRVVFGSDIPMALAPGKSVEINDQYTYVTPVPWPLSICDDRRRIAFTSFLYEELRAIRTGAMRAGLPAEAVAQVFAGNGMALLKAP